MRSLQKVSTRESCYSLILFGKKIPLNLFSQLFNHLDYLTKKVLWEGWVVQEG